MKFLIVPVSLGSTILCGCFTNGFAFNVPVRQHSVVPEVRKSRLQNPKLYPCKTSVRRQHVEITSTALDDNEPDVVIQIEDLSLSQISELIEMSFIQACMVHR
jgi:hypothetical protein